ncbi:pyridoxamine 5'-phosphate oxidase family protein [Actinomycetospora cinnamomea]|uniref:Pyridoxamine 5'-phosphate oxidase n=1 Tax=Actinomycetospora cinnamomea TaxID=663609 RepID=A0A2U1EAU1_9PSEU|nr:pyridoxamine 5'-phosphate oxidase family protein [Actinomycetospora cinnamomea]PVY97073.1 pyridoxamine 5'-phosphate oxidase [Actinomycetospora cinnamomea]
MLTDQDRTLLDRPLLGLLTVPPPAGRVPAPRPVWFETTPGGELQLFSFTSSPKVRRLEDDPRASLVVVAPADEEERWVSVTADVSVSSDGARELAGRLAERYWDTTTPEHRAMLDEWSTTDLRRIVLHPTAVTRGPA